MPDTWICADCLTPALIIDGRCAREGYPGLCVTCSTKRADKADKLAVVDWLIEHLRYQLVAAQRNLDEEARHTGREIADLTAELEREQRKDPRW
jgi:hypothetical protein